MASKATTKAVAKRATAKAETVTVEGVVNPVFDFANVTEAKRIAAEGTPAERRAFIAEAFETEAEMNRLATEAGAKQNTAGAYAYHAAAPMIGDFEGAEWRYAKDFAAAYGRSESLITGWKRLDRLVFTIGLDPAGTLYRHLSSESRMNNRETAKAIAEAETAEGFEKAYRALGWTERDGRWVNAKAEQAAIAAAEEKAEKDKAERERQNNLTADEKATEKAEKAREAFLAATVSVDADLKSTVWFDARIAEVEKILATLRAERDAAAKREAEETATDSGAATGDEAETAKQAEAVQV